MLVTFLYVLLLPILLLGALFANDTGVFERVWRDMVEPIRESLTKVEEMLKGMWVGLCKFAWADE
jgi:hypothetical protein